MNRAFNVAKNQKYDGYQRGHVSIVYRFIDKKTASGVAMLPNKFVVKNENMLKQESAEELQKAIIRKFK